MGSEEEEKNWKGIVIALVVIGAILGLIATAIYFVNPSKSRCNNTDFLCRLCHVVQLLRVSVSGSL